MKQHVRVEVPNENKEYAAVKIVSVYEKENTLYVVSDLTGNRDKKEVPESVWDGVYVNVNSDKDLEVKHIIQVPKEAVAKEKIDDYKEKLKDANCLYGKDIRSYKDQLLVSMNRLQMPDMKWLRSALYGHSRMWWGVGIAATAAVAGIFAVRQFGADIQEKATNVFHRTFR